ncbi:MAG: PilZ domain-containing protein [Deltaproteobacteria bacterium]|nr:PilZ domain-containing protein [Deltaproteobacteria bacterium]
MGEKRERRLCTRTPFLTDVTLWLGDVDTGIEADLLNISINGMFVRIDQIIQVGTPCTIEIRVTGNHSRLRLEDIQGEVVRQDEHGVAIHFVSKMEWFVIFKVYTHCSREEIEKVGGGDSGV